MPFICRVYTPARNFTFSQHPFPSASGSSAHYTYGPKKAFKKYSLPLSEILHTVSFFHPQASRVPEKLMITSCLRLLSELSTFKQRRYSHSHLCEQCFPLKQLLILRTVSMFKAQKSDAKTKNCQRAVRRQSRRATHRPKTLAICWKSCLPSAKEPQSSRTPCARPESYRVLSSNAEGSNCCQRDRDSPVC